MALRNDNALNRMFAGEPQITQILAIITTSSATDSGVPDLVAATGLNPMYIDRVLIWLLKYDYIRRLPKAC